MEKVADGPVHRRLSVCHPAFSSRGALWRLEACCIAFAHYAILLMPSTPNYWPEKDRLCKIAPAGIKRRHAQASGSS